VLVWLPRCLHSRRRRRRREELAHVELQRATCVSSARDDAWIRWSSDVYTDVTNISLQWIPPPKEGRREWPRRSLFAAVGSGARTARIWRATVILQKRPSIFWNSTHASQALSVYFAKSTSYYFEINPQYRSDGLQFLYKKDLFIENQPALQRHSVFFARNSLDFSEINP
jgi:hypothetical protein